MDYEKKQLNKALQGKYARSILLIGSSGIGKTSLIYDIYQFKRITCVYDIRVNWIKTNDPRYNKYSFDKMSDPNRKNWFGLKYPKDSDF